MNIFEILNQGKGAVNENNISAFLAYLLNPNETHGLKDAVLQKFLTSINYDMNTYDTLQVKDIRLEVPVRDTSTSNLRVVDIFLELYTPFVGEHIIAIENKILGYSVRERQLLDECEFISNTKIPFDFVFLTPQKHNKNILPEINHLKQQYGNSFHQLYWSGNNDSVISLLNSILLMETQGELPPITEYVKQTIKSFIYYISHKDINLLKSCIPFTLYYNGKPKDFIIKQYSDFKAELFIKHSNTYEPLKNKTLTILSGFVEYYHHRKPANTHHAADLFIKALKSSNGKTSLIEWNHIQQKNQF
ncbi:MAG: PD-(D/E)XK nuclease family protein [Azospirillum sp.]|nr:PD-(D/E)XK nuclease family protein [Azospirillum sp.]